MLHNYLLTFWRILLRNKVYTGLNIAGLAIGISSCILILLYIQDELSYDKHFDKADRIYKVTSSISMQGDKQTISTIPFPFASTLEQMYPDLEATVRLQGMPKQTVWFEDRMLNVEGLFFSDETFFDVFSHDFLLGNPTTVLQAPNTIVLTKDMAEKLFGSPQAAMGKVIRTSKRPLEVTGVIENPKQSHLKFTGLVSMTSFDKEAIAQKEKAWYNYTSHTYVLLKDPKQQSEFYNAVSGFGGSVMGPMYKKDNLNIEVNFYPHPITEIHLGESLSNEITPAGNRTNLYIFGFVAAFVLLIASINYTNLATARASKRAQEVGLRKTIGADRSQLVWQFLGESLLMTLIATVLALALVEFLLPSFNLLTDKNIDHSTLMSSHLLLALFALVVLITVLAGGYPAFFLSGFKPMTVLKSSRMPNSGGAMLRKSLVVTQFAISIALIICTIVVIKQMHYLKNSDLGFNKEQVMVIAIQPGDTAVVNHLASIKGELLQNPKITEVAATTYVPGDDIGTSLYHFPNGGAYEERSFNSIWVGFGFMDLLGAELVDGRFFSEDHPNDLNTVIINEATAKHLNWKNPVGQNIRAGDTDLKVIGMVKDFNYQSLHNAVQPLLIFPASGWAKYVTVRLSPEDVRSTISFVEEKWGAFDQKHPMEYYFLDEHFDKQYRAEEKMLTVFGYFTLLTVIIACMGLFGLAAFTAEERKKEIGIRKVLGSSVSDIVLLLSRDFAVLVLIAILIACPVAWYGMHIWLQDFAYKTELSWIMFAAASFIALAVALLTVSYQALKAASLDPVKTLRTQ
ncbi:ABC transporter permease [Pontibacter cellulosilyticus]|uniref:ABC transporter permease n=1 Tax=Pontibacter cellulosilyticus TaxID=1720253 RepID=A0A923SIE9_9BACT|nr:ABC transporter permease [Pontibacter cellulosilyticus]MBC5992678.1 ABC transporter permease [Pontibacter cellulosilyticus]